MNWIHAQGIGAAVCLALFASTNPPGAGSLHGRVLDANGNPVEKARVVAAEGAVATIFYSTPEGVFATSPSETDAALGTVGHLTGKTATDADGRFTIGDLRTGRFTLFAVEASKGCVARFDLDSSATADLELKLEPAAWIEGRFSGFNFDASRHVFDVKPTVPLRNIVLTPIVQYQDGDRFRAGPLPQVASWRLTLSDWVRARAYRATLFEETVAIEKGSTAHFDVDLSKGASVTGRVLDARAEPVSDMSVIAYPLEGAAFSRGAVTDEQGRFTILGVPDGACRLDARRWIMRPTAGCGVGPRDAVTDGRVDVIAGRAAPIELRVARAVRAPAVGEAAPDFTVLALDGRKLALADLRGKVVLIDFWATWCGLCRAEFPRLRETYRLFGGGTDFEIVGASIDDEPAAAARVANGLKLPWPQTALGAAEKNSLAQIYDVASTPSSFLIDREGRIVAEHLAGEDLRAELRKLLGPRDSNR